MGKEYKVLSFVVSPICGMVTTLDETKDRKSIKNLGKRKRRTNRLA